MRLSTSIVIISMVCLCSPCLPVYAQQELAGNSIELVTPPLDPDGISATAPAKACLVFPKRVLCYSAPKHDPEFGINPKKRVVTLKSGDEAVLFTAEASAGGSGSLNHVALLQVQGARLSNILPDIALTEQSEYQLWREPSISPIALFITADYVWGPKETHFSSHRFLVSAYDFDVETKSYFLRDKYLTSEKYSSLDESESIKVLDREKQEILTRLKRQQMSK